MSTPFYLFTEAEARIKHFQPEAFKEFKVSHHSAGVSLSSSEKPLMEEISSILSFNLHQ